MPSAALKTTEERTNEVLEATKKLYELGISKSAYPELNTFFQDVNTFIRGTEYSLSGRIVLPGIGRVLVYNMCITSGVKTTIILKNPNNH